MKQENQFILEEKPRAIQRRQNHKASEGAEENALCIGQNAQKRNDGIWRNVQCSSQDLAQPATSGPSTQLLTGSRFSPSVPQPGTIFVFFLHTIFFGFYIQLLWSFCL